MFRKYVLATQSSSGSLVVGPLVGPFATNLKKTQIVKKKMARTEIVKDFKGSNWTILKNSNCDKTPNLKLGPNSKTQIVNKLKNSIYDKTKKIK